MHCRRPISPPRCGRFSSGSATAKSCWAMSAASMSRGDLLARTSSSSGEGRQRRAPVRHAHRRRRRAAQLLRPSGMGSVCTRPENDRRRHRNPPPTAHRVRAGRARSRGHARRRMLLTFVIVGGGPTGVEMAGAMAEIARCSLKHEFRHIDPSDAQILLDRSRRPRPAARTRPICRQKPSSRCSDWASSCAPRRWSPTSRNDAVAVELGGGREQIPTQAVVWAAGVEASPLAKRWPKRPARTLDRAGRVIVEPDLSLPNHPEIFVLGDMANYSHQDGKATPRRRPGRHPARPLRGEAHRLPSSRQDRLTNVSTTATAATWPRSAARPRSPTSANSISAAFSPGCCGSWST